MYTCLNRVAKGLFVKAGALSQPAEHPLGTTLTPGTPQLPLNHTLIARVGSSRTYSAFLIIS